MVGTKTEMNVPANFNLTPGGQIYKYRLESRIGQGHFGQVWRAVDLAIGREYAIKILKPGIAVDERLKEARVGNLLEHNNLVRVHQADVVPLQGDHVVILAMDFLSAGSVERLANPVGYLTLRDALRIARDMLQGLDYLHANNFFHNDIKPGNILIGQQGQAMLADYGIAGVSPDGSPVPAPASYKFHKAPEVERTGNVGVSSDIFQAGMTLFRLLVGLSLLQSKKAALSWTEYDTALVNGQLITAADFPSHIPASVRRLVLKAIHPDSEQRFPSALDMKRSVERLHFPGFWSVDQSGREFGQSAAGLFHYQAEPTVGGSFDLECFKTSSSGRRQRVTRFCARGLPQEQAYAVINRFKLHVVTGK